jgi:glycosyltransferase involved in cell wall biosynthesis
MRVFYIWFYARPFPDYPKIAAALRERGHNVWWAGYDEAGNLVWNEGGRKVAGVRGPRPLRGSPGRLPVARLLWQALAFLGFIFRLRRFLRRHQPDVVHVCPNNARLVWLLPLLMPRQIHFVIDYRQIAQREGLWRGFWSNGMRTIACRFLFDHATFLHAAGAQKVLGPSWARWATVVPLGVDSRFLGGPAAHVEDKIAGYRRADTDGKVRFLYLGSVARVRKLEAILCAAQQMARTTTNFQLDFIGPDVAAGFYQRHVDRLGLNHVVAFRPAIPYDDVPATLSSYDVALAITPEDPPDWRYQPTIKIVEYRALGIPIIATDFVPNRELVWHEANGLLVKNSVDEIAAAMLRFTCDPAFLQYCRANAQAMRQGVTWEEIADMYLKQVYQKVLGYSGE